MILAAPPPPTLLSPANGSVCQSLTPLLDWNDVPTAATYNLQVSTNSGFTTTVINLTGLTSSQYTAPPAVLGSNIVYYWRVSATNGAGTSSYSSVWNFRTVVGSPTLIQPPNNATGVSLTPTLDWTDVTDLGIGNSDLRIEKYIRTRDSESQISNDLVPSYRLQVSTNAGFGSFVLDTANLPSSTFSMPSGILTNNTTYYWRVNASEAGCTGAYSSVFQFTTLAGNPPAGLTLTVIPGGFYNQGTGQLYMKDTIRVLLVDSASCTRMDSARVVLDSVTYSAAIMFNIAPTGNYYIFVYHRNHIPISTRFTQTITRGSTVSYNFSADSTNTYGSNVVRVSTSPLRYGMIPGDANRDEYVDGLDQTIWIAENGLDGYQASDFNGDFFVDGLDQTIWILNNGASSFLPCIFFDVGRRNDEKIMELLKERHRKFKSSR
jgi:hypothetical protein